jgi:hypothetical protein
MLPSTGYEIDFNLESPLGDTPSRLLMDFPGL